MGEYEAVLDIILYLRAHEGTALACMKNPDNTYVDSYTKEIWEDIIKLGLGRKLWEVAFPS